MEPPEPTSAKFKLWRWLLLLSVITVALGGFVWWKSRSERLRFVETIWSDSLAGHEHDTATGQRRKIGEVWELTRSCGFAIGERGLSKEFEGRYPVFTSGNRFQQTVSERLLAYLREYATESVKFDWSEWWDDLKADSGGTNREFTEISSEVLFASDRAVSLRVRARSPFGHSQSTGKHFIERDGEPHEIEVADWFLGTDWQGTITDFCIADLKGQGVKFTGGESAEIVALRRRILIAHITQKGFVVKSDGLTCYFPAYLVDWPLSREFEVSIPFEKLVNHLRPNGPHRLFQTKVSE